MRGVVLVLIVLGSMMLLPGNGGALSWPKAILAVANTSDATTLADGTQADTPCVRTCVSAGVPQVTKDVQCLPAPYGCPFLWQATGKVHLRIENTTTGETCETYFIHEAGWCGKFQEGGLLRFTLTAESSNSESLIVFH